MHVCTGRHVISRAALIAAAAAAVHTGAHAQVFGTALSTRVVDAAQRCLPTGTLAGVTLLSGSRSRAVAPPPRDTIRHGDALRVAANTDVLMRADPPQAANNEIVLAPGLLCGVRGTIVEGIRARSGAAEFSFVRETERGAPRLTLVIRRGAAIVRWPRDATIPLYVHAAGETVRITGTVVAVAVDSTGREGIFLLENGTASLASLLAAPRASQLYHLREGQPSVPLDVSPNALLESIRYHASGWPAVPELPPRRAGWSGMRIAAVAGGVAAAGVAAVLLWPRGEDSDDRPRRGTVIIRIPH